MRLRKVRLPITESGFRGATGAGVARGDLSDSAGKKKLDVHGLSPRNRDVAAERPQHQHRAGIAKYSRMPSGATPPPPSAPARRLTGNLTVTLPLKLLARASKPVPPESMSRMSPE